jgi:hypothetical protein
LRVLRNAEVGTITDAVAAWISNYYLSQNRIAFFFSPSVLPLTITPQVLRLESLPIFGPKREEVTGEQIYELYNLYFSPSHGDQKNSMSGISTTHGRG